MCGAGPSIANVISAASHVSEIVMCEYYADNRQALRSSQPLNGHVYMYVTFSEKTVRVFFSGDYEFLCRMYGISGAAG